jgi:steroid delta-isomerase-like uncharacterized protein
MSAEENKAVVRRMVEEIWNQGNMATFDELFADDFTSHDPTAPGGMRNKAAYRQWILEVRSAYPDLHFATEGIYADGDIVVWRGTTSGTHKGVFLGIPATNTHGSVAAVDIVRVAGSKCHETWEQWDALSLFQQMGVLPSLEQIVMSAASQRPPQGPTPGAPAPH